MTEIAERYRRVADRFTARADEVANDDWDRPAPCEGWVARDVVRHLVDWVPAFFAAGDGPTLPVGPSVDDDPAAAWRTMSDGIEALLDDPVASATIVSHPRVGDHRFDEAIATFVVGDVFIHTWDLARATGLDETLDTEIVHEMLGEVAAMDEALRSSGHFGPRVAVPADADEQTKLLAFTGRRP
jgi:uncharacterized protein (TIGR03086 family)